MIRAAGSCCRLKIQQAQRVEDRLLAANRQLDKELPALVKEALAEAVAILAAQPDKPTRQATLAIVQPLVDRYLQHERPDLAEAVIKATADVPAGARLADWALWVRANLLQREAARTLALQAAQSEGKPPAALVDAHKAELPLLHKLIAEHPQSEHYQAAVDRFAQIATVYLNHRSYDVARSVLADFLKSHGKLNVAVRIEYELAKISLHQAELAFNERKEKVSRRNSCWPSTRRRSKRSPRSSRPIRRAITRPRRKRTCSPSPASMPRPARGRWSARCSRSLPPRSPIFAVPRS